MHGQVGPGMKKVQVPLYLKLANILGCLLFIIYQFKQVGTYVYAYRHIRPLYALDNPVLITLSTFQTYASKVSQFDQITNQMKKPQSGQILHTLYNLISMQQQNRLYYTKLTDFLFAENDLTLIWTRENFCLNFCQFLMIQVHFFPITVTAHHLKRQTLFTLYFLYL